jgi:hypothetical protein
MAVYKAFIDLDAKMNFDDNALFHHKDLEELRDPDEEEASERQAAKHKLDHIKVERQYLLRGQRRRPRHGGNGHYQSESRQGRTPPWA